MRLDSLRSRLLASLLVPLLVVGLLAGGGAFVFTEKRLTAAYDQNLIDIAAALLPHLRRQDDGVILEFHPEADQVLRADRVDRIYYAVLANDGRFLAGDRGLPTPPVAATPEPTLYDGIYLGVPVRMVALAERVDGVAVTILAAETTHKREQASLETLLSALLPVAVLLLAAIAAVIYGVRLGLGPLGMLRTEIQARSHTDLSPIDEEHAVEELKPMVRELNALLARLADAQARQTRFVGNAAHQLRTPIAGLVTQLDLARNEAAARDEHVERARKGAARLARLAQQLLSLAAADPTSNQHAEHVRCDLAEIVRAHADGWVRAALARKMEIEFDLGEAPLTGNPVLLGEIMENLVDNAMRYGAKTVRIATRHWSHTSLVEVSDDGPGIPAAERERVFERFYRVDNEATDGSGLGLAIVSEIALRHRATIEVTDGPEGVGIRVGVAFPA
jgi:two-component system sensor histidine kinase TctE